MLFIYYIYIIICKFFSTVLNFFQYSPAIFAVLSWIFFSISPEFFSVQVLQIFRYKSCTFCSISPALFSVQVLKFFQYKYWIFFRGGFCLFSFKEYKMSVCGKGIKTNRPLRRRTMPFTLALPIRQGSAFTGICSSLPKNLRFFGNPVSVFALSSAPSADCSPSGRNALGDVVP